MQAHARVRASGLAFSTRSKLSNALTRPGSKVRNVSNTVGSGQRKLLPARKAVLDARDGEVSSEDIEGKQKDELYDNDFEDFDIPDAQGCLTTHQVQELMSVVCQETKFTEIKLEMGGFAFRARRHAAASSRSQEIPAAATVEPVTASQPASAQELPFQSTASIDESQILPSPQKPSGSVSSMDEDDFDENLLYIGAPKVGILRRGRYVKGRRIGKGPVAEEGSKVKKGQPLAFIEQLGTYVPVEAPQAGEIVSFNIEDGLPVEYKDVILEIAPFFGGHIIGDRKYA